MQATDAPLAAAPAGPALRLAAVFGGLAVGLGAFAAHAMQSRFDEAALRTFETGVRYQMYHALALLGCAALHRIGVRTTAATWLFTVGIALFSGSLYGLVLLELRWLGPVTPIGGVALLAGWLSLLLAARRRTGHGSGEG